MRKLSGLLLILALASCKQEKELYIDLSGAWTVNLDREDQGVAEQWFNTLFTETVALPGSLVENGMGDDISLSSHWTGQIVDSSWYLAE
jgi:hypothetical protein